MRKLIFTLLAVLIASLPLLAMPQGLNTAAPWQTTGKTLASFPLTTSGSLITEDANTVAHVYWDGSQLVDTKGNSWTMNGTVPQVSANPFTTTRYGAGPFSGSNYYSLASTNPLQFTGNFTVCIVYYHATDTSAQALLTVGDGSTTGYRIQVNSGGRPYLIADGFNGGTENVNDTGAATVGAINVLCVGADSGSIKLKGNLRTTISATPTAPYTAGTSAAQIGYQTAAFAGTIYEIWATTTPWNEASVTAIQQKVLGHFDGSSALSVTRALSNATYLNGSCAGTDQCLWTVPANVARITTDGLLVEPQRINYALQSNTMSSGTAATSPWALSNATVTTVAGAPLTGTWAEVTSTTNAGFLGNLGVTVGAGATQVASVWAAKASGTGEASFVLRATTSPPASCTCGRSDGGSCTASVTLGNYCKVLVTDLGTTPVRIWLVVTDGTTPNLAPQFLLYGGNQGVSTGTTRFTGAQLEVGTYPTSLIVTTTTSATRNADQVSATVPSLPSKFSIAGTYKKGNGAPWTSGTPWSLGTAAGANSASLTMGAANLVFTVIDGSTASKTCTVTSPGYAAGSSQALTAKDLAGTLSLTGGCTQAGAGSGSFGTAPTTLYLGQTSAGDQFSGFIKSLTLNKVSK